MARSVWMLLFSCVTVRALHEVNPAGRRGQQRHFMKVQSPSAVNNTAPVAPSVPPVVVQRSVAVVTASWIIFGGLTEVKTRVKRRDEIKVKQVDDASQKLGASGATFVLAVLPFATVLELAFIEKDNATSLGLYTLAAVLAVVARQAAGAGSGGVAAELVKLSQTDIVTELPPILSSSVASFNLLVTIIIELIKRK